MALTFVDWLEEKYGKNKEYLNVAYDGILDSVESDLCYDIKRDDKFPNNVDQEISLEESGKRMSGHIMMMGGCTEALEVFHKVWKEYTEYYSNNSSKETK